MEILLQTLAPPSIFDISCIKSVRIWNSGEVNPAEITTFLPTSFQFLASRQRNKNGKWVNARSYRFTSPAYCTPLYYFHTNLPTINEYSASQAKVSYKVRPFVVRPAVLDAYMGLNSSMLFYANSAWHILENCTRCANNGISLAEI